MGGAQALSGTLPTTFNNLTISTSGAKTLTTIPTINGIFSLSGTATVSATPTYGSAATLQYNTATARTAGVEWISPFAATGGVIIGSTGIITLNSAEVFSASIPLTINSGATLATNNFSLTLGGNFTKTGTFTAGSSPIVITGAATTQSIDGFTTTGNVSMTKSAGTATLGGVVSAGSMTVNGTGGMLSLGTGLTHTAGTLTLGTTGEPAGSWGGTGAAATFVNTTYFSAANGLLNVSTGSCAAGSWIGNISTDWNTATNWCDGVVPIASTNVSIPAGGNQPVIGATAVCNNLTIATSTSLTITGSNTLTISGNFTNNGTFTPNTSTVIYNGTAQTVGAATYNNLTLSGSAVKTTTGVTVNGVISMEGTATASVLPTYGAASTLQYNTATARTAGVEWPTPFAGTGGVIIASTGVITLNSAKVVNAPFTINSGSNLNTSAASNYALTFGGNFVNSGTFTANASPITITGPGTQSIAGFTTTGALTCDKSAGVATLTGNVNAASLTNSTAGGTLNLGTGLTHTISGTWTRTNGTLDGGSSILNIGGSVTNTAGAFTVGTSTVNYTGAAQTIADVNYYNLTLSGSAAKTMGANITTIGGNLSLSGTASATTAAALAITGNLTVGTGTTLATGANATWTLGVTGVTSVTGTLTLANTGNKTFTGDVTLNSGANWNETGIAAIGFAGNFTNNATTFTALSGTHTFSGAAKTFSGTKATAIANTAVTGSYTNNGTLTVSTALTGVSLTQGTTGVLNIGGTSTITTLTATATFNIVNYNGAAQSVFNTNYYDLKLSGSAAKTLQTGTTAIGGTLTLSGTASTTGVAGLSIGNDVIIGSGTTFTSGAFTHNVGGNWTNTGGTFTSTGGTINFTGNSAEIDGTAATQTFNNIIINKTAGQTFIIAGSTTTLNVGGTFTETSGNFTAPATMTITGNNTLTAGTFTAGANLTFNGATWTNTAGVFAANSGTVTFGLGGAQALSGTLATTFNNLTVSTSGVKTLTTIPTVNGIFSLSGTATVSAAPTYGSAATLQYNTTTSRTAGAEWITPFVATGGVVIGSTGTITMNAVKVFNSTALCTFNRGSTLAMLTFLLTLNGNLIKNGGTTTGSGGVKITGTATQRIGSFTHTGTILMSKTAAVATLTGALTGGALTINGTGGTLNLGTTLTHTFSGIVTLTAGSLNGGSSTLNENATSATAWNGTGSLFTAGTGTVSFGGVAQTLAATATTFNNLTIAGGGAKTLSTTTNVNGTLTLTSGLLTLGTNNLILGASSPAVAGTFSATNMIVTNSTGSVQKLYTANGSYLFPIGEVTGTTEYSPVTLNFVSGTYAGGAYATARVTNAKQGNNTSVSNYLNRYWTVTQSGITSFSANVTGTYLPADIVGTEASIVAALYPGALPWIKYSTLASNTLTATAVTSLGDFSGVSSVPVIVTSVASLTGFTYPVGFGPSAEQSFTVSGSDLSANMTVTAPTNFEISTGTGALFVATSPINLTAVSGAVATTTIYVRMKSGIALGSVAAANVVSASTGATSKNVACSGTVATAPVITTSVSSLTGFTYVFTAGPSAQQTFTVSGTNLVANVIVTAPTDYEISTTSGSGFVSTFISLTPTTGTLSATTIYVRLKNALGVGTYVENVVASSTSATSKNVSSTGTITAAPTLVTSTSYLGGFIYATGTGPSGSQSFVVTGSGLTANVTVLAPDSFEISTNNTTFVKTISLTQSGGAVSSTIYARLKTGKTAGTYGPANVTLASTGAVVKTVAFAGSVVGTATIATTKSTITGFGYLYSAGGPSSEQTFTVSGALLTANIALTAPTNYEISRTSGSGFKDTLDLRRPNGTRVNPTPIYVRLKSGLAAGNYTGVNITVASATAGITTLNVACVGIVFISPLVTAGGGGTFCAGSTINLTSVGADILNRYWQGPSSYYSTAQNPTITSSTTDMTGTYTVTGNVVVGGNLVTNGDFEAGNTSFGSSYTISNGAADGLWPESVFAVIANPNTQHTNFSACVDHTSGSGKQMVINGAPTAGVVIWSQSVPVIPGASYEFTYWVQTVVAESPSKLQLYVNGVAAGPIYTADLTTCTWKQFIYNTTAGSNSSLNLELINQNTAASGNDFSLDDIVFQQILQATSSVDVTVNPVLPVSVTVAASANPVYTNTPVTFTATPTNGGATPAYQWKVNGVAVSGATNVTYTYQPHHGDIVLCELTSSLSCVSNNPANANVVMTVITRVNYWYGYNSTDWGTASNWTANYVPLTGDDVEYATVANFGSTAIRDLQLDINRTIGSLINATTQRLLIPAAKGLLVNNNISTDNNPDRIYIYSSTTLANGSLSYHNIVSNPVYASVEMYSKASWDKLQIQGSRFQWQYFGIPLRSVVAYPQFTDAYVRKWYETGTSISNHWIQLTNSSTILPYYGYELCQQSPKTYLFKGILENGNFSSGQLAITSGALYPGQHVFANPYTAAIDIKQLTFGSQTEATVYIYHTGTYNAWTAGGQTTPDTIKPGYYIAVPKNFAGDLPGIPRQVPSMGTMLVKAMSVSTLATFGITYNSVIMNNTDQQRVRNNSSAITSDKLCTTIELKGNNSEDKLWLIADPNCTRDFDNGWDGFKIVGTSLSPQIYAMEKDGNYQVNALDDINDTDLGFQAGTDSEYTLNFTQQNLETKYAGVYLVDLLENKTIDITQTGSTYTFTANSTPTAEKRFKIVTRYYEKDAPDAETQIKVFSANGTVFVQNLGTQNGEVMLYNMSGRFVKSITFAGNAITAVAKSLIPGAYIAKAITNNEEVSKRIIVR
ncbi:MAG: T9SS type A sorting domain-containing protein [Paludibacter sp.]